jgi:hypothetical protein
MSVVMDRQTFETRLSAAQETIKSLTPQTEALRHKLGDLLADGEEADAKRVQEQLEEKLKELDRAKIQFIYLESRRPLLAQSEAKQRLAEIVARLGVLAKGRQEERYAEMLDRLSAIVDDVMDLVADWNESRTLRAEADYQALLAGVPLPELPADPELEWDGLHELIAELEIRASLDAPPALLQWTQKKNAELQTRRRQERQNGKRK